MKTVYLKEVQKRLFYYKRNTLNQGVLMGQDYLVLVLFQQLIFYLNCYKRTINFINGCSKKTIILVQNDNPCP